MAFDHMNSTRFLMEARIQNCLKVDGKELVCVTLLADSESAPDRCE